MATRTSGRAPQPQPAAARPPTAAGWAHAVVQIISGIGLLVGLWLVVGRDLAILIASATVFTGSIILETLSRRGPRPAPPTPGGDR